MYKFYFALLIILGLAACNINQTQQFDQLVEITDPNHVLFGVKAEYNKDTFITPVNLEFGYAPAQAPILYNHYYMSPPVHIGPTAHPLNANQFVRLTLPLRSYNNGTGMADPEIFFNDIYVLGWGDNGWETLDIVKKTKDSISIDIDQIIYSPFVAVADNDRATK